MAVTYTNNWKNIADKLRNIFRTEFGASLPVYIGEGEYAGSQFLKILPVSNEISERLTSGEIREFVFSLNIYIMPSNSYTTNLTNMLRILSRIESLIGNHRFMELTDNTSIMEGTIDTYVINEGDEGFEYVVEMDYICSHYGNRS